MSARKLIIIYDRLSNFTELVSLKIVFRTLRNPYDKYLPTSLLIETSQESPRGIRYDKNDNIIKTETVEFIMIMSEQTVLERKSNVSLEKFEDIAASGCEQEHNFRHSISHQQASKQTV